MLDSLLDQLARRRGIGEAYHDYRGELTRVQRPDQDRDPRRDGLQRRPTRPPSSASSQDLDDGALALACCRPCACCDPGRAGVVDRDCRPSRSATPLDWRWSRRRRRTSVTDARSAGDLGRGRAPRAATAAGCTRRWLTAAGRPAARPAHAAACA
ncbi:MAG: hypothetical protein MZV49_12650 [Rhodopseudomonas palustris]|nr:hypothetical protein [Rhodopseudomonas palustris]